MDRPPLLSAAARARLCADIETAVAGIVSDTCTMHSDATLSLGLPALVAAPGYAGARELAGLLKVLRTVYECALESKTVTLRELYYLNAAYFASASEATGALSLACAALRRERHELGVLAASRGKVAGLLALRSAGGGAWDDLAASGGTAAISGDAVAAPPAVALRGARFILLVEKDAIFARLAEDRLWETLPCILVTACGMPDLASRAFLRHLTDCTRLPVLGLFDANPFGLAILLCYVRGSAADGRRYTVPVRWLGLRLADARAFALPASAAQRLSAVDERKAALLLEDGYVATAGTALAAAIADEARAFADCRVKMELEGILSRGIRYLAATFLPTKIAARDWVAGDDEPAISRS